MIFFWILWILCACVLLTLIYFFFDSVRTTPGGPPKSFFQAAFFVFTFVITALLGSLWLVSNEYRILAKVLLLIPDLPAVVFLLWLLRAATWRGPWN